MKKFDARLAANQGRTLERAVSLDGRAWTAAVWGLDLAVAEENAQEAVEIVDELKGKPEINETIISYVEDTRGYILLQLEHWESARQVLESAARAVENPGATFRYALALHIMGQENAAEQNLTRAMRDGGYWPSHELVLLRNHFDGSGKFMETFQQITKRSETLNQPCPLAQN